MKINQKIKTLLPLAGLALSAGSANAAVILSFEDFEAATSTTDFAATDYDKGANDSTIDQNGIANTPSDSGDNLTKTYFGRSSNRFAILRDALPLDTNAHTSLEVTFDYYYQNMSSTRGITLQYSASGLFDDTQNVNQWLAGTLNNQWQYDTTVTLTEGTYTFTDTAKIRFKSGGSANNQHGYLDNIEIKGVGGVPEPTTTALLGLGGLALILRRRK